METLLRDIGYAFRVLRRSPSFTTTAVLTLGLAIGANTAIFSAVQGVLVAPLPYPHPERLFRLFEEAPTNPHFPMAPADFRDYRSELQTFEHLAAYVRADLQLGDARPEQLRGMQVSSGFFALLGCRVALGREFLPDEEIEGRNNVAMLSHALWMRRFDGDPAVVGTAVRFSGRLYQIVGVLPPGFQHVGGTYRTYGHGEAVDVWTALPVPRIEHPRFRFSHYFNVVGRVRAGVSAAAMTADLERVSRNVAKRYPAPNSPWTSSATPLKAEIVGTAESTLFVLAAAAAGVLLIACVNVAGLLLGRGSSRVREIGIRAAIGATRARLTRQLLMESAVLAVAGAALGLGLAFAAIAALARFGPQEIPRLQMIGVNPTVLLYALGTTVMSALLFGLAPAWRLARSGAGEVLRAGGRTIAGSPHQHLRRALATAQVALAFALVVASGLLIRSFIAMIDTDPGFRPAGAITASIELPTARYDRAGAREFFRRVIERADALPGVRSSAFSSDLPWTGYDENTSFEIVGRTARDGEGPEARYHFVSGGYTEATGTPVIAGRALTHADNQNTPRVVMLNESAARKYWPSPADAVGARLSLWGAERTVIGVIGNVRDMPWHDRAVPALYFPQAQEWYPQPMFLVVRADVEHGTTIDAIQRAIRELDPELPLASIRSLAAVAGAAMATRRLTLWLVGAFGLIALFLAVVGIYGVMAQVVGQRRHEIGVRQALGATRADIVRLVLTSAAVMTIVGIVAGAALAAGSTRFLSSQLFDVTPLDPITFAGVTCILIAAAAVATLVPARRAAGVTAAAALRTPD